MKVFTSRRSEQHCTYSSFRKNKGITFQYKLTYEHDDQYKLTYEHDDHDYIVILVLNHMLQLIIVFRLFSILCCRWLPALGELWPIQERPE